MTLRRCKKLKALRFGAAYGSGANPMSFIDVYHVDGFQQMRLCPTLPETESAIVGPWSEVEKYARFINCPVCESLVAIVRANGWQHFYLSQQHSLVDMVREVLNAAR